MVYMYYCLAFVFVYFEIHAIVYARQIIVESIKTQKIIEDQKARGRFDGRDIDRNYIRMYLFDLLYIVWSIIGLLSSQWVFFVMLFLLTFLSSVTRSKTYDEATLSEAVRLDRANSLLSIVLLVLIVCNKAFCWFDMPRSILELLGVWS